MGERKTDKSRIDPTGPERKGKDRGQSPAESSSGGPWGDAAAEVQRRRGDARSDVEPDSGAKRK